MARDRILWRPVVSATMNPVAGKARNIWTITCLAALRCLVFGSVRMLSWYEMLLSYEPSPILCMSLRFPVVQFP
jgi:hypothetical protein